MASLESWPGIVEIFWLCEQKITTIICMVFVPSSPNSSLHMASCSLSQKSENAILARVIAVFLNLRWVERGVKVDIPYLSGIIPVLKMPDYRYIRALPAGILAP